MVWVKLAVHASRLPSASLNWTVVVGFVRSTSNTVCALLISERGAGADPGKEPGIAESEGPDVFANGTGEPRRCPAPENMRAPAGGV